MSNKLNNRGLWLARHPKTMTAIGVAVVVIIPAIAIAILLGIAFLAIQFIKWAWGA